MSDSLMLPVHAGDKPVSMRNIAALMFRRKWLFSASFFGIFCLAVIAAALLPRTYESSLKLLVARERAETFVSAGRTEGSPYASDEISEAELSSEVELLRTDDLLRSVVLNQGLAGPHPTPLQVDKAVQQLSTRLKIGPINKSNLIQVTYRSGDPRRAAGVLNALASLFLAKEIAVRPHGQYAFFDQQAAEYKQRLADIERQIAAARVVAPEERKVKTVDQVTELQTNLSATRAQIAEVERRIATLSQLKTTLPERMTTESKTSDNPQLLQTLKATLLTLELKRDELLSKYQPGYRPVQDVEKEIADTRAALARQQAQPLREETTDRNSTFEWVRTELAKSQTELQGLQGREAASQKILNEYQSELRTLNQLGLGEGDLQREAKTAEANYLLYSQKREEARISDELDRKGVLNVMVVQPAAVPTLHVHQRKKLAALGTFAAIVLGLSVVLLFDSLDPRFRSSDEITTSLDIPVLAAIPGTYELTRLSWSPALKRRDFKGPIAGDLGRTPQDSAAIPHREPQV
jgi:uncharacterized protein involved in exopolysaccharide biosynthesis